MVGLVERQIDYLNKENAKISSGFADTNQRPYSKTVEALDSNLSDKNKALNNSLSINRYLLMIAKLENEIKSKTLKNAELDSALAQIAEKIKQFSPREIKILEKNTDYLKLGFPNDPAMLKKFMAGKLATSDGQASMFAFLKSRPFISLIKGEPLKSAVYHKNDTETTSFVNRPLNFNRHALSSKYLGVESYQQNIKAATA